MAPVEISLNKIAVDKDNSYAELLRLMYEGYTTVKWNLEMQDEACELCKAIAAKIGNGVSLPNFLGYRVIRNESKLDENGKPTLEYEKVVDIYKDAPIYNWSHVGCKCYLTVFKDDTGDMKIVSHNS